MNLWFACCLFSITLSSLSSSLELFSTLPLKVVKSRALSTFKRHVPNSECSSDLTSMVSRANDLNLWALKMLDASGKMGPGLFKGNIHIMGDYDQCLSISEEVGGRTIDGQYCTVHVSIKLEEMGFGNSSAHLKNNLKMFFPDWDTDTLDGQETLQLPDKARVSYNFANPAFINLGLCVPKSCSADDLENLGRHVVSKYMIPVQATVSEKMCSYRGKSVGITHLDVFIYTFFTVIFLVMVSSTIYDLNLRRSGQNPNLYVSFSAYTNLEKLFSGLNTDNNLSSLCGIRVINTCWIILGHVTLGATFFSKNPVEVLTEWQDTAPALLAKGCIRGVTGFFTMSGFLVSYLYLRKYEKESLSLLSFYWNRILRLTPVLLATTFVQTSVLKLFADGPYGPWGVNIYTDTCQSNWWRDLFIFFNWSPYEACQLHAWSVLADFQFYFWTPMILFFIRKYPRTVLTGTMLLILAGIIYSAGVTIHMRLGVLIYGWNADVLDYIYLSHLHQSSSWLMGIVLGYILCQEKIKISKRLNLILWIVAMHVMLIIIFGQPFFFTEEYNVYRAAAWNGLATPLWSLSFGFIIFSCTAGNGGCINTFLSKPIFRILSRLSYCIYLTHMGVLVTYMGSTKEISYLNEPRAIFDFCLVFLITLMCSLPLYLGFEAPILALKDHFVEISKRNNNKKIS